MDDPHQFIETITEVQIITECVEYRLINTVNIHSEGIDEIENMNKYKELKERYGLG